MKLKLTQIFTIYADVDMSFYPDCNTEEEAIAYEQRNLQNGEYYLIDNSDCEIKAEVVLVKDDDTRSEPKESH